MIYVYLIYKYWMSIKTPGLHSLIKHSSALLSNDDSVFDVIIDHIIYFKVNQVLIIGEFWLVPCGKITKNHFDWWKRMKTSRKVVRWTPWPGTSLNDKLFTPVCSLRQNYH